MRVTQKGQVTIPLAVNAVVLAEIALSPGATLIAPQG
jgi:hypothetical protein